MEKENLISDFPFIAHDVTGTKAKRQIPTFVRAHVMERYHRERRAKKGIKDSGNPVWSQHEFVASDRNGQVLRWEVDDQDAAASRAKTIKKPRKKKIVSQDAKAEAEVATKEIKWETSNEVSMRERSESPEVKLEDFQEFKRAVALQIQGTPKWEQVRSLMPKHEVEQSGMQLIRILNDYYGQLGEVDNDFNPWHTLWLPFAFSDRALFHASLSKFSVHFAATCGATATGVELLKHKGKAMEKLSVTIADTNTMPSDATIATAICLIGTEMLSPDQSALPFHVRGVRRMIAMRGGVTRLNTNPIFVAGYLSYEYILAILGVEDNPELLKALSVPAPRALLFPSQTGIFSLARKRFNPTTFGISQDSVSFLSALCEYLCISDVFVQPNTIDVNGKGWLETLIQNFDRKESQRAYIDGQSVRPNDPQEDHILQALLLTCALQLPQLATTSRIGRATYGERLQQLQYHIAKSPNHSYWRPLPGALLWCLVVGTSNSKGGPQSGFFLASLIRATCGLAFLSCEPVRIALATFQKLAQEQKQIERDILDDSTSRLGYV